MIKINSEIYPYRLDTKTKEPVELKLDITNLNVESKLLSCDIILDPKLRLKKNGLQKSKHIRVGDIGSKQTITYKFDIHPFQGIKPGKEYKIKIRIAEHLDDYKHVEDMTEHFVHIKTI